MPDKQNEILVGEILANENFVLYQDYDIIS